MNTQQPRNTHSLGFVAVTAFLIPSLALGSSFGMTVEPRIIVIVDSSSSMQVAPDDLYGHVFNMTDPGGDYNPADPLGTSCASKFCSAKSVVASTVPNFTDQAKIGLATYFQFLVKYQTANTQYTKCYYDQMYKAGQTLTFSSPNNYPAMSTLQPDNLVGKCVDNPADEYAVTQTGSMVAFPFRCADYTYPAFASRNYGAAPPTAATSEINPGSSASACKASTDYPIVYQATSQWNTPSSAPTGTPSKYVENAIGPTGTVCPAAVPISGGVPSGAASTVLTAPYTVGTATGNWQGVTAGECTTLAGAPCQMYSVSPTYREDDNKNSWFGLYTTAQFTPSATASTTPALASVISQTDTNVGTVCTGNNCATGLTAASTAMCLATGTYTGGQTWNGTFGFPKTNAAPFKSGTSPPAGYTESTPGTNNPVCSPASAGNAGPCYVTLLAQVPTTPMNMTTIYDNVPAPTGTVTGPTQDNNGGAYYWRLSSSCNGSYSGVTNATGFIASNAPMGCSSSPNMDCSFTRVSNNSMQSTGCTNNLVRYDNASPATCASPLGNFSYTAVMPAGTDLQSVVNLPPGSNCSAFTTMSLVNPGVNGCPAGGTKCYIKSVATGSGTAVPSSGQATSSPTPAGFTGSPTKVANQITWTDPTMAGCPSSGAMHSTDPTVCGTGGTPCDVDSNGLQTFAVMGETQVKKCQYQTYTYTWSTAQVTCTLKFPNVTFTVAQTAPVCTYTRSVYTDTTAGTTTYQCRYQASYSRHDFLSVQQRWCEYYRMHTAYEYDTRTYNYSYQTKGGELMSYRDSSGTWQSFITQQPAAAQNLCATTYADATGFVPGGECPPTIDACAGAGTYCKLRWGSPRGAGDVGASTNRYQWALTRDSRMCMAADQAPSGAVLATAPSAIITANTVSGATPGLETTCLHDGVASDFEYRLFSDWYDPSVSNILNGTNISPTPIGMAGTYTFGTPGWSNQGKKNSGWSAFAGAPGVGTAADTDGGLLSTASQVFIDVPADNDDPAADKAAIAAAMQPCELPTASNVDPNTLAWNHKGMCMVQDYYQNAPGLRDFTPLYGSILNATQYMSDLRKADDPAADSCRKRFVILATDGLESTPNTPVDLTGAVTSLCGPLDSRNQCSNVSTFVIAFGNAATADPTQLNAMAAAGSTGQAFIATDTASLRQAITSALISATAGTYSRSKPAISTDGTRLYASQYTKCGYALTANCAANGSEAGKWKGYLYAYSMTPTGLVTDWEFSAKLNGQSDGSRVIKTDIAGLTTDFATGNPVLSTVLASDINYPGLLKLPPDDIVKWVRNASLDEPYYYDHTGAQPSTTPTRSTRLDAIQHSSAVVVGKSPYGSDWAGADGTSISSYSTFQTAAQTRPTRILVGSNDGLLHGVVENSGAAICASSPLLEQDPACPNGSEGWAWVPSPQLPDLYQALQTHVDGVDGTAAVADVCGTVAGGVSSDAYSCNQWKTVAIASMRGGWSTNYPSNNLVGLQLHADGSVPTWLWNFNDANLGDTWSVPVIGRVDTGSGDHFVAVFGGGHRETGGPAGVGDSMYVVDSLTGTAINSWAPIDESGNEMAGRPVMFRRPVNAYMDTVVSGGSDGVLQVMRFANSSFSQFGNPNKWKPTPFFNPSDPKDDKNVGGAVTPVQTIVQGVDPVTLMPSYTLVNVGTLPLATSPEIYNRPKAIALYDATGNTADYYVGTGDAVNLARSIPTNYFYALHDFDHQLPGAGHPDDGVPLWVVAMPQRCTGGINDGNICSIAGDCPGGGACGPSYEQIVSEPAVISGAVIVASYIPPAPSAGCSAEGDTVLYAFDPITGALTPAIIDPTLTQTLPDGGTPDGGTQGGVAVPVDRLPGVGVPSDLLVVNNQLYLSTSSGGVVSRTVQPRPNQGDIRSFRRIR